MIFTDTPDHKQIIRMPSSPILIAAARALAERQSNPDCEIQKPKTKKIKWSRAAFATENKDAPDNWYKFPGTFINKTLQDKITDATGGSRIVYYKYKKFEDAVAAADKFPLNRCLGIIKSRDNYQLRVGRPGKFTWQGEDLTIDGSNGILKRSPERSWGQEISYLRIDPYNQDHYNAMASGWCKDGEDITHEQFLSKIAEPEPEPEPASAEVPPKYAAEDPAPKKKIKFKRVKKFNIKK